MKWLVLLCAVGVYGMTIEEKVGQLLMVHFHGTELNDEARRLIDEAHVGGFCYYDYLNDLSSREQTLNLSEALQGYSKRPLLIAVDQEGGCVQRLRKWAHWIPAASEMEQPYDAGFITGQDLANCGINLDLAPVLDLYLGRGRSFSSDPDTVTQSAKEFIAGLNACGVSHCLKHFPGHGFTTVDSHDALPISEFDPKNLKPFRELLEGAPFVMCAHVLIPAVDHEHPVTFSNRWLTQVLRCEMHYKGVVISDSLTMDGSLSQCSSLCEAALKALVAGCDILLIGRKGLSGEAAESECLVDDIIQVHRYLVDCVRSGQISEDRINRSVERITDLKNQDVNVSSSLRR